MSFSQRIIENCKLSEDLEKHKLDLCIHYINTFLEAQVTALERVTMKGTIESQLVKIVRPYFLDSKAFREVVKRLFLQLNFSDCMVITNHEAYSLEHVSTVEDFEQFTHIDGFCVMVFFKGEYEPPNHDVTV